MLGGIDPEIKAEWEAKLKETGFQDLEDSKGRLRTPDRRTISFDNRDRIRDFFLTLDAWLESKPPNLSILNRRVLELYSCGLQLRNIAQKTGKSPDRIKQIVAQYKKIILDRM